MSEAPKPGEGPPRYKRSAKNYLIDPQFQLKYTGFLVGIALALSAGLGALLWRASSEILDQNRNTVSQGQETVKQGQSTVDRGKEVIVQSNKVNQVVTSTIESCYGDNPELLKSFKDDAAKDDVRLKEEQKRLEADAAALKQRAEQLQKEVGEVEARQRSMTMGLVAGLLALVLGIGAAGIVLTHKIAGPIFKMKRLLRQVGEGKLVVRERLRKGDELVHFFETFEQMVENMRGRQKAEIARVDEILAKLVEAGAPSDGVDELRKLRADMQDHLEP